MVLWPDRHQYLLVLLSPEHVTSSLCPTCPCVSDPAGGEGPGRSSRSSAQPGRPDGDPQHPPAAAEPGPAGPEPVGTPSGAKLGMFPTHLHRLRLPRRDPEERQGHRSGSSTLPSGRPGPRRALEQSSASLSRPPPSARRRNPPPRTLLPLVPSPGQVGSIAEVIRGTRLYVPADGEAAEAEPPEGEPADGRTARS